MQPIIPRLLAMFLACAASCTAHAQAGRVQFASGDVRLVLQDGTSRPAQKADPVSVGDTIVTGANSVAQLKMADDGLIAVRPDTQLRVDTFTYSGREDGTERSVLGLLKGGFRTLTGAIGRTNKTNYLVRTPNATIGIRGTDHEPLFIPAPGPGEVPIGTPGTYNKVNVGETFIESSGQRIELGANQAGFASLQAGTPPVRLDRVPGFMRATPVQQGRDGRRDVRDPAQGDQRRIAAGPGQPPGPGAQGPGPMGPARAGGPLPSGALPPVFAQKTSTQLALQQIAVKLSPAPADYVAMGADLSPATGSGSGALQVGINGASLAFGPDGFPALVAVGNGFQYARSGAPLVDAGVITYNDAGTPVEIRWGIYAGGSAIDANGPRVTQYFQFMGAQGTPAAVVAGLSGSYTTPVGGSKLVTEGGVLGGSVTAANIVLSAGKLVTYGLSMTDGQARSWSASCPACSAGVALTTFRDNGVVLSGSGPGTGVSGKAQGWPVGPTGSAVVSSFNLKTVQGQTVSGTVAVK